VGEYGQEIREKKGGGKAKGISPQTGHKVYSSRIMGNKRGTCSNRERKERGNNNFKCAPVSAATGFSSPIYLKGGGSVRVANLVKSTTL